MTNPFRLPDPLHQSTSEEVPTGAGSPDSLFERDDEIRQVAKTLAEHGADAVAFDLALDLVLNEIVQQALHTTDATGAAIALTRDGEMVCRATTGTNAPDLGVKVEMDSGLSGACLRSGQIQDCADSETDQRVNAETCRQLGVRSMLIAPIKDGEQCFGILEVLSTRANAFAERDVNTLLVLARLVAEKKRDAEQGTFNPAEPLEAMRADVRGDRYEYAEQSSGAGEISPEPVVDEGGGLWTTVLVVLVIGVAIVLGVVIGWRGAFVGRTAVGTQNPAALNAAKVNSDQSTAADSNHPTALTGAGFEQQNPAEKPAETRPQNPVPPGGLVVTQNGQVIYRVEPTNAVRAPTNRGVAQSSGNLLVHRIEPQYPLEAREKGIQGPVILDVQIQRDGRVGTVNVVSGDPMLSEAAVMAVKQWVYQPFAMNGKPVERQTRITIRFVLPSSE